MSQPKTNVDYKQRRLFCLTRRLTVLRDGVLNIMRKSPLDECEWQIDLSMVNPEFQTRKSYSPFWLSFMVGSLICMLIVAVAFKLNHQVGHLTIEFVKDIAIYVGGFVFSFIFYLRSRCEYTLFKYESDKEHFAFSLYTNMPSKQKYDAFIKDIQQEIRNARIAGKKRDVEQIEGAIELLYKDRIISDHAHAVMLQRMDDMDYFAN